MGFADNSRRSWTCGPHFQTHPGVQIVNERNAESPAPKVSRKIHRGQLTATDGWRKPALGTYLETCPQNPCLGNFSNSWIVTLPQNGLQIPPAQAELDKYITRLVLNASQTQRGQQYCSRGVHTVWVSSRPALLEQLRCHKAPSYVLQARGIV